MEDKLYEVEKQVGATKARKNIVRYIEELDIETKRIREIQDFLREAHSAITTGNVEFSPPKTEVALSINSPHLNFGGSTENNITIDITGAEKFIRFRDITLRKNELNNNVIFIVSPVIIPDQTLVECELQNINEDNDDVV